MTQEEQWLLEEKYQGEKTEGFFADCKKLESGEPLAYIIGSIPFLNTTIHLDSHPLIPRTETEYWVEHILLNIKILDTPHTQVLDLCAGSGCVGVAVLKNTHYVHVDFAELEEKHHPTILHNIASNEIDLSRANVVGGSLFTNVTNTYDFILSNPPYIDKSLDRTESSVTRFEPHEALYADDRGLFYIKMILTDAHAHLTPNGTLLLEHEPEQSQEISNLATQHGFISNTFEDQYGVERYTILTRETT